MTYIATYAEGYEAPSGQVFGSLESENGCLVFRSREKNRTFLALLPPGSAMTASGKVLLANGKKGVVTIGTPTMFNGGQGFNAKIHLNRCGGDQMILDGTAN